MLKTKTKTTNNTHYAFSDNDIQILLKGLKEKDSDHLDNEKICLDPITLERFHSGDDNVDKVLLVLYLMTGVLILTIQINMVVLHL